MKANRSLTTTVFTMVVAFGTVFAPVGSKAQGQLDSSKRATIFKFRKNVENLDLAAKKMVNEARTDSKKYRGETSELRALSRHSELTGNLVKATLIGNPAVLRKASLDVDNNLRNLKLLRKKSKNPEKIDQLISVSIEPTNFIVSNLNDFNKANIEQPTAIAVPVGKAKDKKPKPGQAISKLIKKTFN